MYAGVGVLVTSANLPFNNWVATFLEISLTEAGNTPSSSLIAIPPVGRASGCKNNLSSGLDPGNGVISPWSSILWKNKC